MTEASGKVYLIGAGPGDPGLLTLKAKACIESADVVVYDYLASPFLLDYAQKDAEIIYVGKKGGDHTLTQDKINLLGICQGGTFSLCYSSMHPEKVSNLVTMVTPVDFHTPDNMLTNWARNIDIDLQGPELLPLMNAAKVGQDAINERFSDWSVRALPGTTLSKPELQLVPDDIRITQAGLDRGAVADAVRAFTGGLDAGRHFDGNEGLDVLIWSGEWTTPEDLAGLPVFTPQSGIQVIGELASIQRTVGPTQLRRVNGQRTVTLQVLPPADMTIEDALATMRDEIGPVIRDALPDDADIHYRGTADQLAGAIMDMGRNFVLAVLILALIMAAMFRSVRDSMIVLLVMPLAVVGGVIGLRILNLFTYQSLELLTMIGFIILLGLVVNNAILLVHQTRAAERDGADRATAVAQAIRIRARPIFMSTLTSICGMLPLMLVPGVGSEIYRGLATVIVGGMSVSAVFTLLLLPSILRLGESRNKLAGRRALVPAARTTT